MKIRLLLKLLLMTLLFPEGYAQKKDQLRVEPPFWWTDMSNDTLQLMVYGKDIAKSTVALQYAGVTIMGTSVLESPNYIFLNLLVSQEAQPGKLVIEFRDGKKVIKQPYELRSRTLSKGRNQGFNTSDVIYLIMPDRFSNGDEKNDNFHDMPDKADRSAPYGRHGGDIKGIENHLDYVKDLGATAIWINPLLENNMVKSSYHGYSITDFYTIDARFGSNEDFVHLVERSHAKGIKIIMDMVLNHMGSNHWWMKDLPSKDWIHQFEKFTRSNFHLSIWSDPHVSREDMKIMEKGWFDNTMPDLNQSNPYLGRYLLQNTLWWLEYSGLDGIRLDTYPYSERSYLAYWSSEVMKAYPTTNIVGEVWTPSVPQASYWVKNSSEKYGHQSGLPSVTDFPLYESMNNALNKPDSWNDGLGRLYHTLSEDFLYEDPNKNMIFLDNHDLTRTYTLLKEDLNKYKIGITLLMTLRGFPQLYYGSEILMTGDAAEHSNIRHDFPGGWPSDSRNAFTKEGRTAKENEAFNYLRTLAHWRKNNPDLMAGKLTHFIPGNGLYVYFRHTDSKSAMVIVNTSSEVRKVNLDRFSEMLSDCSSGTNIINGEVLKLKGLKEIAIDPVSSMVVELTK